MALADDLSRAARPAGGDPSRRWLERPFHDRDRACREDIARAFGFGGGMDCRSAGFVHGFVS